jgi:hypothetical protein
MLDKELFRQNENLILKINSPSSGRLAAQKTQCASKSLWQDRALGQQSCPIRPVICYNQKE